MHPRRVRRPRRCRPCASWLRALRQVLVADAERPRQGPCIGAGRPGVRTDAYFSACHGPFDARKRSRTLRPRFHSPFGGTPTIWARTCPVDVTGPGAAAGGLVAAGIPRLTLWSVPAVRSTGLRRTSGRFLPARLHHERDHLGSRQRPQPQHGRRYARVRLCTTTAPGAADATHRGSSSRRARSRETAMCMKGAGCCSSRRRPWATRAGAVAWRWRVRRRRDLAGSWTGGAQV